MLFDNLNKFFGSIYSRKIVDLLSNLAIWSSSVLCVMTGIIWYCQESLLFHPNTPTGMRSPDSNPEPYQNPFQCGMPYEDVYLETPDNVRLHGWFIKQKVSYETAPTLIFFQGNAGNTGFRLMNFLALYEMSKINIFAVAYRGYGKSEGTPSEDGFYMDAQTILEYIVSRNDIDKTKVVAFGRSLGGAVVINLAYQDKYQKLKGIIVENTFTSIKDMVYFLFPVFRLFPFIVALAQRLRFESIKKICGVKCPILFISGAKDTLVPPKQVELLYMSAKASAFRKMYVVHNGSHNDTWQIQLEDYCKEITNFLDKVFQLNDTCKNPSSQKFSKMVVKEVH